MRLDRRLFHVGSGSVDVFKKVGLGHCAPLGADQDLQQAEFTARQGGGRSGKACLPGVEIQFYPGHRDLAGDGTGATAGEGTHARLQLIHLERLDQVVIRSGIEPLHTVHRFGARSQQQHGTVIPPQPQVAQHGQAVEPRQVDVENDQFSGIAAQQVVCILPVCQDIDRVTQVPQPIRDTFRQAFVIFYKCDPHPDRRLRFFAPCKLAARFAGHTGTIKLSKWLGNGLAAWWRPDHLGRKPMTKLTTTRRVALGLCAASAMAFAAPAQAEVDLSGETVEFVIPFSESGGSARWANFFAPLLSEHLPGNPTVVVRYRPGAGSTSGANWFQEQTTDDGTLIFGTSGSTQFPYLLGDPRVRYEYNDWRVVLASGTGGVAYLSPEMGAMMDGLDATGLQGTDFIWGSQGATRLDLVANLAWEMLGLNVEPVFGIEGRGDGRLMFERGEANIDYQTSSAYLRSVVPLVEGGLAVPMMTWGALDNDGNIVRDPTFPDIPTFMEVCDATPACSTEGAAWEAWRAFFIAGFPAQKMIFLPGSTSDEVVQAYTDALNEIIARDDFAALAEATLGVYPQMTGAGATAAFNLGTQVPDEARDFVINWLQERYGVSLN